MSKILYVFDAADWDSRTPVAQRALDRGHDVTLGLIGVRNNTAHNFKIHEIKKNQRKFGVASLLNLTGQIHDIVGQEKPDIIHAVTLKYAFLTALATIKQPDMRKIYTLAGLGYMFHGNDQKSNLLRHSMKPLLSYLFKRPNTKLIFQNPDDMRIMIERGYVREADCTLIRGSGVDLERFQAPANEQDPPIVLMPTRLVHEKGVAVFVEAARILKTRGIKASFQIAGGETTHNPKAISREDMQDMVKDGAAQWLGRVENLPELLSRASLVVYPSYYGEGIPRVLLEACAAGKAIVTTDHTGCREAVTHGVNGLLVPIKDALATADAIHDLLAHPNKRRDMGENSKLRAKKEFDIHKIATLTVGIYESDKFDSSSQNVPV